MSKKNLEIAAFIAIGTAILVIWGLQLLKPEAPKTQEFILKTPEIKEVKIEEDTPQYKLTVSYPEIHNLGDPVRVAAANNLIKEKIQKSIGVFKEASQEVVDISPEIKSEMQMGYEVIYVNPSVLSIKIRESTYIEGDPHPLGIFWSVNYNFRDNREVALADLFNPGSNYLLALSDLSRKKLKSQLGEYYSEESIGFGTAPKPENFAVFFLTKDKLIITFNVYSVASYAAGPQTIEVPYEELGGSVDSEGLIKLIEQ